jgi:hypothetical protein
MLLRKLATLGLLGLAAVILTELTYRVYLFGPDGLTYEKMNSVHEIGLSGLIQPSAYPEVLYELKPNQDTWFKLARFRTNSAGLPDREYSLTKPENTFRIVLVGSSFSMPSGVAMEDSWQELLERDLNAQAGGKSYEVINFSVGGYDIRQLLATLKQRALAYTPDLALVELTLGSPSRMRVEEAYHQPFTPRAQTYPFFESFAVERLLPAAAQPEPAWALPASEMPMAFEQVLAGFRSFADRSRLPVCFVILQHDPGQAEATRKLREQAGRFSSCIIDTSPAFANERFSDLIVLKNDAHPNPRAQRIFARVVLDQLRARELVEAAR